VRRDVARAAQGRAPQKDRDAPQDYPKNAPRPFFQLFENNELLHQLLRLRQRHNRCHFFSRPRVFFLCRCQEGKKHEFSII
jgi:hypothetical protein